MARLCNDRSLANRYVFRKLRNVETRGDFISANIMMLADKGEPVGRVSSRFLFNDDKNRRAFGSRLMAYCDGPAPKSADNLPRVSLSMFQVSDQAVSHAAQRRLLAFPLLCDCVCITVSLDNPSSIEGASEWARQALQTTRQERVRLGLTPTPAVLLIGTHEKSSYSSENHALLKSTAAQIARKHCVKASATLVSLASLASDEHNSADRAMAVALGLIRKNDPHFRSRLDAEMTACLRK